LAIQSLLSAVDSFGADYKLLGIQASREPTT